MRASLRLWRAELTSVMDDDREVRGDLPARMELMFDELWPLTRSITGPGVRASMDIVSQIMPLERLAFRSGQRIFDWTIPKEWDVRDAFIVTPSGQRIAHLATNNLHLVSYSVPIRETM